MSRPKPKILLEKLNQETHKKEEVLESDAIYAVFYQSKPINLKSLSNIYNYPPPKYKKTSFSNPGHAFNLASKLNEFFETTEFKVFKLTSGQQIDEQK